MLTFMVGLWIGAAAGAIVMGVIASGSEKGKYEDELFNTLKDLLTAIHQDDIHKPAAVAARAVIAKVEGENL